MIYYDAIKMSCPAARKGPKFIPFGLFPIKGRGSLGERDRFGKSVYGSHSTAHAGPVVAAHGHLRQVHVSVQRQV